jgi:hypothetical protein
MNLHAIDLLAHSSNLLLLVSYSVRNMLWLRWFAVAAALTVIPYYILQPVLLWPPVFWGLVFTGINLYQIGRIYAERRPVVFSGDEQKLYDLGFRSLRPREFISLMLVGEWKDAAPGDRLLTEGESVSAICIPIAGTIQIHQQGRSVAMMEPGHAIGTALALTGHSSPVSASFIDAGRYIRWPLSDIRVFLDKKPELRHALQQLVSRELAGKLEKALSDSRGLA